MSGKIVQLNEEVIKGQLKELVRGSVEESLNELLEAEAEKLTQAARYERNEQRQGYRSGHYNRNLTTTSGDVTLKVPKLKGISFETAIIAFQYVTFKWGLCGSHRLTDLFEKKGRLTKTVEKKQDPNVPYCFVAKGERRWKHGQITGHRLGAAGGLFFVCHGPWSGGTDRTGGGGGRDGDAHGGPHL